VPSSVDGTGDGQAPTDKTGGPGEGKGRSARGQAPTTGTIAPPAPSDPPAPIEPDGWLNAFLTPAVPDAPADTGDGEPAPADLASGRDDAGPRDRGVSDPLVLGTIVGIVAFLLGGAVLLWRNRPSRFWPA
jgi:hypothetical protein